MAMTVGDSLSVPILFLIFNRPEATREVFRKIRAARPSRLFVAADGPRVERDGESQCCDEVRRIAMEVDWPCEIKTLFREKNLGCRAAVSSAIDWFFDHVERGIILEDDCVPTKEFFMFCQTMLDIYESDTRVMHIAGTNLNDGFDFEGKSYVFSQYTPIWGWATWQRAWRNYDVNLSTFDEFRRNGCGRISFPARLERWHRMALYELVRKGRINTWDYQWNYALVANRGLSVIPAKSMVTNIGFGEDATHTKKVRRYSKHSNGQNITFPLRHPSFVNVNYAYDRSYFGNVVRKISPVVRIILKLRIPEPLYSALKRLAS